jgi:2-phosphosulfolactate phosphatase
LYVHFLPALVQPEAFRGAVAVVVDVLRASTTIIQALASGARAVVPCLEVGEAHQTARAISHGQYVLGGERGGLRIEGFHLGNSPAEYTPQAVGGKTVVFTTTNGTRALNHARAADEVLIGALVNFSAVLARARGSAIAGGRPIHILCAGTQSEITSEDVLCAGAMIERLQALDALTGAALNDEAFLALAAWRQVNSETQRGGLAEVLQTSSRGGGNLACQGMAGDIEFAAKMDRLALVPRLDVAAWKIVAAGS